MHRSMSDHDECMHDECSAGKTKPKETINGAQRLHTVLVARAAQEFPETRASAHPRLMLRRREKKRLVHDRHHHQAGRQLYA